MAYAVDGRWASPVQYNAYASGPPSTYSERDAYTDPTDPGHESPPLLNPRQILETSAPSFLVAPLPTVATLTAVLHAVQQPSYDPAGQIAWCRDALSLAERAQKPDPNTHSAPYRLDDPALQHVIDVALPMLLKLSSRRKPMQSFVPGYVAEAMYLCATCEASGAYPQYIALNPKQAFTHFEHAAKAGYHAAWNNLGRDFERFGNIPHARSCFERGASHGSPHCLYRLGLAHLTGQLGLPVSPDAALPLLKQAAALATVDFPEPAYVYALLLLNEFTTISLPPALLATYIPPNSSPDLEARAHLERAAYLNHAPAQHRLGRAYELADAGCVFDAVLSVQYYWLASQQGELEADMALSKWFLCGCEEVFSKDETLAYEFAQRAARRDLPSAQFALGYYAEVGIGGPKDVSAAQKWYTLASEHGNTDAPERLQALSRSQSLSRQEHEQLTENQLVRKRTQARLRSQANPRSQLPPVPTSDSYNAPPPPPSVPQVAPLNIRKGTAPAAGSQNAPAYPTGPQRYGSPSRSASAAVGGGPQYQPRPAASAGFPPGPNSRTAVQSPGPSNPIPYNQQPNQRSGSQSLQDRPMTPPQAQTQMSPQPRPSHKGPQTFQEMGISVQGAAEEKECVIM